MIYMGGCQQSLRRILGGPRPLIEVGCYANIDPSGVLRGRRHFGGQRVGEPVQRFARGRDCPSPESASCRFESVGIPGAHSRGISALYRRFVSTATKRLEKQFAVLIGAELVSCSRMGLAHSVRPGRRVQAVPLRPVSHTTFPPCRPR